MFDPQPKPEFHNYPLRVSDLSKLNKQMSDLDHQIYENRNQIQQIRKKFQNEQYQNVYIQRLMQKNRILQLKKQQLQYVNKMHQFHQFTQNKQKKIESKLRSNLANEYKQQIEQNRRKKSLQKQRQIMHDRELLQQRQQSLQCISRQKLYYTSKLEHGNVRDNVLMQQCHSVNQQRQRQLQKRAYIQSISHPQQSQKNSAFDQFYKKNRQKQQRLSEIYNMSTAPLNNKKLTLLNQVQQKNQFQYVKTLQRKANEQIQRRKQNKQQLKQYLQKQMQEKSIKNQHDKQTKMTEDMNRSKERINNQRYDVQSKQKAKMQQLLYSSQLSRQYNQQLHLQKVNSQRGKQHSYMNQSTQAIITKNQAHSPQSPKTGIFLGHQKGRSSTHNPLTNPIPFSIGMTNPYILKQFQNKRVSNSTWGSNLAKLGDQSFKY